MNFISNPQHYLRSKRQTTTVDYFYAIEAPAPKHDSTVAHVIMVVGTIVVVLLVFGAFK